jgi:hypothetical protein
MAFLDYVHFACKNRKGQENISVVATTAKATPPRFPEALGIACAWHLHLVVECVPLLEGLT